MRILRSTYSCILLGAAVLPGCSVYDKLAHNLIVDPAHYDRYSDKIGRCVRDKCLAEEAWDEIIARDGEAYSRHYYRGFMDGFTDYLDAGGSGDPPPLPPRSYWRLYYQTPEGQDAIQDWFHGFRHGTDVARASGVRELVTIPVSSVPPKDVVEDPSQAAMDARQESMGDGPRTMPPPAPKGVEQMPKPAPAEGPIPMPPKTDGPMPPKTANGKPMPPPTPPIIPVERMIAPPVPKSNTPPPR